MPRMQPPGQDAQEDLRLSCMLLYFKYFAGSVLVARFKYFLRIAAI